MIRAAVVDGTIVPGSLISEVAGHGNGATAVFLGTVRSSNDGRQVSGIEYSAYREMAEAEMMRILTEARERFGLANAALEHRVGALLVGDVSMCAATSAPHRASAMESLHFIVEETKARAPVWKLEHYLDGTREWVGAAHQPGS